MKMPASGLKFILTGMTHPVNPGDKLLPLQVELSRLTFFGPAAGGRQ